LGTQLLEGMVKSGCKKLVCIGTSWQHYNNCEYSPVNLYAATKESFKKILQYYEEAQGIEAVWLELFDTYGPGDKRPKLLSLLREAMLSGKTLEMSPGEQEINLLHVHDVVSGIECAMESLLGGNIQSGIYCLRSDSTLSLKGLVGLIETVSKKKINIVWGGRQYRPREVMKACDVIRVLPGWHEETPLRDGLKEYYAV
jgi:nucleoside-diphosphate-sugar epimerase